MKFQPQLPFVQKHFYPLHALRKRGGGKAQTVSGAGTAGGVKGATAPGEEGGEARREKAGRWEPELGAFPGKSSRKSGENGISGRSPVMLLKAGVGGHGTWGRILRASVLPGRGGEGREHPQPAPAPILPARPPPERHPGSGPTSRGTFPPHW